MSNAIMSSITEDEMDDIKERYELFDKKGDGKVDAAQILDVLRACGLNPMATEVEKVVRESNLEGTRVELAVFCGIYEQVARQPGQVTFEDCVEAFKTFDRDNTGQMSSAELRQLLVNIGDTLTDAQADVIVGPHEDSEKGTIGYVQLIKSLMGSGKK